MSLPPDPKQPYADLPQGPHTLGEILQQVGEATRENLAKVDPPQLRPAPEPPAE